jgi:hypothetical protein
MEIWNISLGLKENRIKNYELGIKNEYRIVIPDLIGNPSATNQHQNPPRQKGGFRLLCNTCSIA